MVIIDKLKSLGVEITPEIEKALSGDWVTKNEMEKKVGKIETERDSFKERAEIAETTLKDFEGKDFDAMQKEVENWKKKAEDAENNFNSKMAEKEKADLLKDALADVVFTSESAKKSVIDELSKSVSVKNGKLIGFNDVIEDIKKNDPSAFKTTDPESGRALFTDKMNNGGAGKTITKDELEGITNKSERIAKRIEYIKEHGTSL